MTDEQLRDLFDARVRAENFVHWKASMRLRQVVRSLAELRRENRFQQARVLIDQGHACTGVSASWCPICGDCTCPRDEDGPVERSVKHPTKPWVTWLEVVHDPDCPLHSTDSPHAEGVVE